MNKMERDTVKYTVLLIMFSVFIFLIVLDVKAASPGYGSKENEAIMNYGPAGVDGSVVISALEFAEVGDSLLLAFNVDVNRRAINNRQSWRIVPELTAPETGAFVEFPTLLITGRQKDRHFQRKERFGNRWLTENYPDYKASIPKGTDTVITYRATVPYQEWMEGANLNLHQYLASPKEKRQLFSSDGYGMVKLEPHEPYIIKPLVNYIVPEKEFKRRTAGYQSIVDFPVNVSWIIPGYRRNPEELSIIDKHLRLIKDNPYVDIETIYMEGYASPEGGTALNARLAMERVHALKDYLVSAHGIRPDKVHINTASEDWQGLRNIVDCWEDEAARHRVLGVIDTDDDPETKEQRLRALLTWDRLVMEVFPLLRRTEYRIDYQVRDFTLEQSRSLIENNPELFSHYELYMLAMSYEGKSAKRLEILEVILRYYPDDDIALNNYAAALIEAGETATARRYLERMSDKSIAANNLGIIFLIDGDYDKAERCFKRSGREESLHNLQELKLKKENAERLN